MPKKKNTKPAKYKFIQRHLPLLAILAVALVVSATVLGWAAYDAAPKKENYTFEPKSRPAYVDGNDAANNVEVFYKSYILTTDRPAFQKRLIEAMGTKNLVFYDDYYQHGFNPITCSTVMPTKVITSLVSTGPVATVNAIAEYPDNSKATIVARVVLSDEGLDIDSITCPGDKGNLPPKHTP